MDARQLELQLKLPSLEETKTPVRPATASHLGRVRREIFEELRAIREEQRLLAASIHTKIEELRT